MQARERKRIAIVRVRGQQGVRREVETTLALLRLNRVNHCVVVENSPHYLGMLALCKDYIAWGAVDAKTFAAMLRKRGRFAGGRKMTDEDAKKSGFASLDELAEKFVSFGASLPQGAKPVFRLRPPRKGYRHVKKPYPEGALGNWGDDINGLIMRMV